MEPREDEVFSRAAVNGKSAAVLQKRQHAGTQLSDATGLAAVKAAQALIMKITRFEEIQAWQEARKLAKEIYNFTKRIQFRKDFNLTNQIQRAVISIMANIAEGFDRQSKKEFAHFLSFASGSTSEVQSHLYVALDQGYVTEEEFKITYSQAQKVKSMINGFMAYLKGKE